MQQKVSCLLLLGIQNSGWVHFQWPNTTYIIRWLHWTDLFEEYHTIWPWARTVAPAKNIKQFKQCHFSKHLMMDVYAINPGPYPVSCSRPFGNEPGPHARFGGGSTPGGEWKHLDLGLKVLSSCALKPVKFNASNDIWLELEYIQTNKNNNNKHIPMQPGDHVFLFIWRELRTRRHRKECPDMHVEPKNAQN